MFSSTARISKVVVWVFVLSAAILSAHDIAGLFERLGVPAPFSYLAVVFIDGIAWLGKLMRNHHLARGTNVTGLTYLIAGAGASLGANIIAGQNIGWKILGGLAVVAFVLGEIAIDKIEPRPEPETKTEPTVDEMLAAKRSEAARKGAETRKRNAAAKSKVTRKPRTPRALAAAPVSPGEVPLHELNASMAQ